MKDVMLSRETLIVIKIYSFRNMLTTMLNTVKYNIKGHELFVTVNAVQEHLKLNKN